MRTDLSLSFGGRVRTQTKTSGQGSGSECEAENIRPSSVLDLCKLVHCSQGQQASMFIGCLRNKCVCVHVHVRMIAPLRFST